MNMKEVLKRAALNLELPILAFPIVVTCVVAFGFIIKCPCSIVEWWLSFALTLAIVWFRTKDRVVAIATTTAMLLMLGLLWLGANLFITSGCEDTLSYHQPAIRMLASGWNPVYQGTPDGILDATGVKSDMICVWHVIAMPKGIWYFSAAAYLFTNAHFNLLFPLMPILYCSLFYAVYNAFCGHGKGFALCGYFCILFFIHACYEMLVDGVVALSAIGLLVTMWDGLRTGKWSWMRLIGFSFWMVVAKQPSQLHCACFWLLFFVFSVVKNRKSCFRRFFVSGMVLLVAFCVVNVAPYVSSYVNYGSPFYPRYSGDEEKYPTRNITGDFFDRNDDAAALGHIGAYVNAFVSTSVAKTYYALQTGKKDFCPNSSVWAQQGPRRSSGSPTSFLFRFMYCTSLVVLCLLGGLCGRFIASCLIIGCAAMPTEMIGFIRYVPYALVGCPLGVLTIVSTVRCAKVRRLLLWTMFVMFTATVMAQFAMFCAVKIDQHYAVSQSLKIAPPSIMVSSFHNWYEKNMSGNLILLRKCVPELSAATLVIEPQNSIGQLDNWQGYFDHSFKVSPEYPICKFSALRQILNMPQRKQRFLAYPKFIVQTIFVTVPKCIWEVIYG